MLKTTLAANIDGTELRTYKDVEGRYVLGTETYGQAYGHFNSEISTANETIVVIAARDKDAFSLTDIVVQTDKANGGLVTLRITDGTYTETLVSGSFNDAPISVNLSVAGRMESWQQCRLELVTSSTAANHTVTCTAGYFRVPEAEARTYQVWNFER